MVVMCPACNLAATDINKHLDSQCKDYLHDPSGPADIQAPSTPSHTSGGGGTLFGTFRTSQNGDGTTNGGGSRPPATPQPSASQKRPASTFFQTPAAKRAAAPARMSLLAGNRKLAPVAGQKRGFDDGPGGGGGRGGPTGQDSSPSVAEAESRVHSMRLDGQQGHPETTTTSTATTAAAAGESNGQVQRLQQQQQQQQPAAKKSKTNRSAPLAERMRPHTLDDVFGQDLVGPGGVLRSLIEQNQVPSMILWGASGTGKTTIARCIARTAGARFIETHAASTGVAEVKKVFQDAANELALTGRKTILFCDEIHRFSKSQQDVFLRPVEAGTVTLVGATTENPSFRVQTALLSRCRTFTLQKLSDEDVLRILERAVEQELEEDEGDDCNGRRSRSPLLDDEMLRYLAAFSDGDARTALNLLELAMSMAYRPGGGGGCAATRESIKASLTKTLVYDRAGDQHYDTISAFHKAVRGSDADAALYYLARMLQSGEDALFIARRLVVVASEDVGLADNTLLPLATAAFTAAQQIGLPEARIPLAHATVALCLAPKSTRAYRGLNNAMAALAEPGVASLPIPLHLRNAPTRLMKDLGYGGGYKYPPNYRDGKVAQDYLPDNLVGRRFLEDRDLGTVVDPDL